MHWILKKNPANKMLIIRTEYFEKISGHIQVGLRIGVFSGQIKPEVVQTEYLKSEYPYCTAARTTGRHDLTILYPVLYIYSTRAFLPSSPHIDLVNKLN